MTAGGCQGHVRTGPAVEGSAGLQARDNRRHQRLLLRDPARRPGRVVFATHRLGRGAVLGGGAVLARSVLAGYERHVVGVVKPRTIERLHQGRAATVMAVAHRIHTVG